MIENDRYFADEIQQASAIIAAVREVALMLIERHLETGASVAAISQRKPVIEEMRAVLQLALVQSRASIRSPGTRRSRCARPRSGIDSSASWLRWSIVSALRRTVNLVCALALTGSSAAGLAFLLFFAHDSRGWMWMAATLVLVAGLLWLWSDFIDATKEEGAGPQKRLKG